MTRNGGRSACDLTLKSTKYSATKYLMLEDPFLMLSILRKARDQPVPGSLFSPARGQERETLGTKLIWYKEKLEQYNQMITVRVQLTLFETRQTVLLKHTSLRSINLGVSAKSKKNENEKLPCRLPFVRGNCVGGVCRECVIFPLIFRGIYFRIR